MAVLLSSPGQAQNGIASPIDKISPTGAVTIPQLEVPSVGTLGDVQPHWVFVNRGNGQDGTRIFDGDTGKMVGQVNMWPGSGKFAFDPNGKYFYVTETNFSGIDRTTREDWLTVSDVHTLKRLAMIPIPTRQVLRAIPHANPSLSFS